MILWYCDIVILWYHDTMTLRNIKCFAWFLFEQFSNHASNAWLRKASFRNEIKTVNDKTHLCPFWNKIKPIPRFRFRFRFNLRSIQQKQASPCRLPSRKRKTPRRPPSRKKKWKKQSVSQMIDLVMTIKNLTGSSKSELSSRGRRLFKVWEKSPHNHASFAWF